MFIDKNFTKPGGKYSSIPIKSYIILDIRETRTVVKAYPNTWHITPNSDFTIFNIQEGKNSFYITTCGKYPHSSGFRVTTQEYEAMEFEMGNLKRKNNEDDNDSKKERCKRKDRRDVIKSLEKLVDVLTKREKYLRDRGAFEEANKVQQKLDKASDDLTKTLCNAVGNSYWNPDIGDSLRNTYWDPDIGNSSSRIAECSDKSKTDDRIKNSVKGKCIIQ
ncbi:6848_t:CDS:1 [Scutellospora calospora]|uniref:6848_t:CDS:1 n=1 Tax=Scutellospora calospora TaxID=85575 RepID=A0ACA9MQS0_9GLOM|nr:6848_t:CDS:1 [Scutellospora calospora]